MKISAGGTKPAVRRSKRIRRKGVVNKHANLATRCPLRILVAEDHPVNRKLIRAALDLMGYTSCVEIVEDGLQVLQSYKHGEFDLILLDIQMPNMTGDEACKALLERFTNLPPIMAITTAVSTPERAQWLNAGFQRVMPKPLDISVLASILESTSSKRKFGEEPKESFPEAVAPSKIEAVVVEG